MDENKVIRPMDFVRLTNIDELNVIKDTKNHIGLVKEVSRDGRMSIIWIGETYSQLAWFKSSELEVVDNLVSILTCGLANFRGDGKESADKFYSIGYDAKIGSSGDGAQIGSSGNNAKIGSFGDGAKIGSSGNNAKIDSTGKDCVIMCAGINPVAKASKGSWITLSEWSYSEGKQRYIPICVKTEFVDGEKIKADTYYSLKGGVFVEWIND